MGTGKVFLIAVESKDIHSLVAFEEELRNQGLKVVLISLFDELKKNDAGLLADTAQEMMPIFVISSVLSFEILSLLRPRNSFVCIGVEHGIAPFKKYTYSSNLLKSDYYLAPTNLWYVRLAALYPASAEKLRLGGYPRLEVLRSMRENVPEIHPAVSEKWIRSSVKNLVVFSWGVDPQAIKFLPDQENIIYLLHPTADINLFNRIFKHAQILVSEQALTPILIAHCSRVFGDFSSLTLEAISLGIPARFVLDRNLYHQYPDIDDEFFNRSSDKFAKIPETTYSIPEYCIIDSDRLSMILKGGVEENDNLNLPVDILPPDGDNRLLSANIISDIAKTHRCDTGLAPTDRLIKRGLESLGAITRVYWEMLGRNPDLGGLKTYFTRFIRSDSAVVGLTDDLRGEIRNSPEWRSKCVIEADRPTQTRDVNGSRPGGLYRSMVESLRRIHYDFLHDPDDSESFKLISLYAAIPEIKLKGDCVTFGVSGDQGARFLASCMSKRQKLIAFVNSDETVGDRGLSGERGVADIDLNNFWKFENSKIRVIRGEFGNALPTFMALLDLPLAFIHMGGSGYESSSDILSYLNDRIVPDAVILFDKYFDEAGGGQFGSDHCGLLDYCEKFGRQFEYLWRTRDAQVAVRIIK